MNRHGNGVEQKIRPLLKVNTEVQINLFGVKLCFENSTVARWRGWPAINDVNICFINQFWIWNNQANTLGNGVERNICTQIFHQIGTVLDQIFVYICLQYFSLSTTRGTINNLVLIVLLYLPELHTQIAKFLFAQAIFGTPWDFIRLFRAVNFTLKVQIKTTI